MVRYKKISEHLKSAFKIQAWMSQTTKRNFKIATKIHLLVIYFERRKFQVLAKGDLLKKLVFIAEMGRDTTSTTTIIYVHCMRLVAGRRMFNLTEMCDCT